MSTSRNNYGKRRQVTDNSPISTVSANNDTQHNDNTLHGLQDNTDDMKQIFLQYTPLPDVLINIILEYYTQLLYSLSHDKTICQWDINTGKCLQTLSDCT